MARKPASRRGAESYRSYRALLMESQRATNDGVAGQRISRVFLATCTGSRLLSGEIGLPLALVDVADDPAAAVRRLSCARHGSCVPWGHPSGAFAANAGWDDWSLTYLGPDMAGTVDLGSGIVIHAGSMRVSYRRTTPLAALRRTVASALRHLRLQDAAWSAEAFRRRVSAGGPAIVTPRFTPLSYPDLARCARVDDLYALDPWVGLPTLALSIGSAVVEADGLCGPGRGGG